MRDLRKQEVAVEAVVHDHVLVRRAFARDVFGAEFHVARVVVPVEGALKVDLADAQILFD